MSAIVNQGEILRVFLKKKKKSITSLAKAIGVSRTSIYNWFEMGIIPEDNLELISEKLGIDFFKIIRDEIDKEDQNENLAYLKALKKTQNLGPINFIDVSIQLDGSEEKLEKAIRQLISLNKSLKD